MAEMVYRQFRVYKKLKGSSDQTLFELVGQQELYSILIQSYYLDQTIFLWTNEVLAMNERTDKAMLEIGYILTIVECLVLAFSLFLIFGRV